jgi:hypothetical protein
MHDDPSMQEIVTANWVRIVNQMARFPDHKANLPSYLKLISVRRKDCGNPIFPRTFSNSENGYELSSEKDYRLEIFQYNEYGPPAKPFSLKLEVDKDRITPVVDEEIIVGQYDFLALYVRPTATLRSYGTSLSLEVKVDSDMRLRVRIPARILRGLGQIVGSVAVAGSFALATLGQGLVSGTVTTNSIALAAIAALFGFLGFYYWGKTPFGKA